MTHSHFHYADLGATVYPSHVPAGLAEELPGLYSSLCTTTEWFSTQDQVTAQGACTLTEPRHVLLFTLENGTIEILNKAFRMAPGDAKRACLALFRAFPNVHRVHLEVMFPARELALPSRVLYHADHQFIGLPSTIEEYRASIGHTRKRLNRFQNRLSRDFPDLSTQVLVAGERSEELFDTFLAWKEARFKALGRQVFWHMVPGLRERYVELLRLRGEAHVTVIDGRMAAIILTFPVGEALYGEQTSFDPRYEDYSLGFVASYLLVCNAIERGARYCGLMWGDEEFKARLGAHPVRATRLSVFPTEKHRLYSLREAGDVMRRYLRTKGETTYWRSRRSVGKQARRLLSVRDAGIVSREP